MTFSTDAGVNATDGGVGQYCQFIRDQSSPVNGKQLILSVGIDGMDPSLQQSRLTAAIGHPLLGDETYGAGFKTKAQHLGPESRAALDDLGRQALHAYLLRMEHPVGGDEVEFRSELPADLQRLRQSLSTESAQFDRKR